LPLIEVRDLHHDFVLRGGESVHALAGLNLSVDPGEYVAIVGANGSGKTTLSLHLNGILQPSRGSVTIDGLCTADPGSLREIRRRVGMVFQSPDDQFVATVVEEDVAFGPENLGVAPDLIETRVRDALVRVGMWDERLRPPHQLSAGQKQRVAIAGALAMNPLCLVLDEVTSMLDPAGARDVLGIIEELHRTGMTVVTIIHKMEEAARSDRVLVLNRGELMTDGAPGAVFGHRELHDWNLNPPPARVLGARLRRYFPGIPHDILDAGHLASALAKVRSS
jgi:energy-coupling factor transporter ATPase